jgi:WD40 repeat protein
MVASGSRDKTARVWRVADGAQLQVFEHINEITALAFRPDGESVVTGPWTRGIRLWSLDTGDSELVSGLEYIRGLAWSADGSRLAAGSWSNSGTVLIWDVASDEERRYLGEKNAEGVASSRDGSLVASGWQDGTVRLLRGSDGELLHTLEKPEGSSGLYLYVALASDDSLLAWSYGDTVEVWAVAGD